MKRLDGLMPHKVYACLCTVSIIEVEPSRCASKHVEGCTGINMGTFKALNPITESAFT